MLDAFLEVLVEKETRRSAREDMADAFMALPSDELHKIASGHTKLADYDEHDWLSKFKGTPLYEPALQLEQQCLELDIQQQQTQQARNEENQQDRALWDAKDGIRLKKRMLDLELLKMESSAEAGGNIANGQAAAGVAAAPAPDAQPPGPPSPSGVGTAGPTDNVPKTAAVNKKAAQWPTGAQGPSELAGAVVGKAGTNIHQLIGETLKGVKKVKRASSPLDEVLKLAAELQAGQREEIKSKNFAVHPKGGEEKYPIHDAAHARNALTRVRQFGTPAEKAQVFAAVTKKYPALATRSDVIPEKQQAKAEKKLGLPKGGESQKKEAPKQKLAVAPAGKSKGMLDRLIEGEEDKRRSPQEKALRFVKKFTAPKVMHAKEGSAYDELILSMRMEKVALSAGQIGALGGAGLGAIGGALTGGAKEPGGESHRVRNALIGAGLGAGVGYGGTKAVSALRKGAPEAAAVAGKAEQAVASSAPAAAAAEQAAASAAPASVNLPKPSAPPSKAPVSSARPAVPPPSAEHMEAARAKGVSLAAPPESARRAAPVPAHPGIPELAAADVAAVPPRPAPARTAPLGQKIPEAADAAAAQRAGAERHVARMQAKGVDVAPLPPKKVVPPRSARGLEQEAVQQAYMTQALNPAGVAAPHRTMFGAPAFTEHVASASIIPPDVLAAMRMQKVAAYMQKEAALPFVGGLKGVSNVFRRGLSTGVSKGAVRAGYSATGPGVLAGLKNVAHYGAGWAAKNPTAAGALAGGAVGAVGGAATAEPGHRFSGALKGTAVGAAGGAALGYGAPRVKSLMGSGASLGQALEGTARQGMSDVGAMGSKAFDTFKKAGPPLPAVAAA